jgi:hypothetical protein
MPVKEEEEEVFYIYKKQKAEGCSVVFYENSVIFTN